MAILEETETTVKRHPVLIIGCIAGAVVLFWLLSRSSSAGTPQNFSFSYGPTTADLQAQTALAVNQANDQTAVSLANIAAGSQAQTTQAQVGVANSYFDYLTSAGNTAAASSATAAQYAYETAAAADNASMANTATAANAAVQTTALSTAAATTQAGYTAGVSNNQTAAALQIGLAQQANLTQSQQQSYTLGLGSQANTAALQQQNYALGLQTAAYSYSDTQAQTQLAANTQANNYALTASAQQITAAQNQYQIFEQGVNYAHGQTQPLAAIPT